MVKAIAEDSEEIVLCNVTHNSLFLIRNKTSLQCLHAGIFFIVFVVCFFSSQLTFSAKFFSPSAF